MTVPHQSMGYPADAPPVRPGSSDALTARTIDATVHPPLVRAQETVTGLVPRVTEAVAPLTSPLFLSAVGLTLTFVLVARRMHYRPSALLLSGLLVTTLTSFRPMPQPEPEPRGVAPVGQVRTPRTMTRGSKAWYRYQLAQRPEDQPPPMPVEEPEPMVAVDEPMPDIAVPPTPPTPPDPVDRVEGPVLLPAPRGFETPPLPFAHLPEVSARMVRSVEQMMRDNERMQRLMQDMRDNQRIQQIMQQVRARVREEGRRRRGQRDYGLVLTR